MREPEPSSRPNFRGMALGAGALLLVFDVPFLVVAAFIVIAGDIFTGPVLVPYFVLAFVALIAGGGLMWWGIVPPRETRRR